MFIQLTNQIFVEEERVALVTKFCRQFRPIFVPDYTATVSSKLRQIHTAADIAIGVSLCNSKCGGSPWMSNRQPFPSTTWREMCVRWVHISRHPLGTIFHLKDLLKWGNLEPKRVFISRSWRDESSLWVSGISTANLYRIPAVLFLDISLSAVYATALT